MAVTRGLAQRREGHGQPSQLRSGSTFALVRKRPGQSSCGRREGDAGFAKVAGIELVLLDAVRYFHQAAGLNGAAQIVHDLGARADPRRLARAAATYENSTARRLGYLLEHFGHTRQASALRPFVKVAKSLKPLDPSVKRLAALGRRASKPREAPTWKLSLNVPLEIDA
jgi:hypothetical protein